MAGDIIRPKDLPNERTSPVASEYMVVDNGVTVAKSKIEDVVKAGRPAASQAEAETGTNSTKAMTPLTTAQAIAAQGDLRFASYAQGAKADTAVQPDSLATVATSGEYNDLAGKPVIPPGLADGDKGDISVSSSGAVWEINKRFDTVAALLADTTMGYAGSGAAVTVGVGDPVEAREFRYEVAASGATDAWLIQTAGGVKLAFAGGSVVTPMAFGALALDDNSLDDHAFTKAYAYLDSIGGGVLTGDLGAVYTLRQTVPCSNITIRDMAIKQVIETDKDGWGAHKIVFKLENVSNVTIENNIMDGQRGSQSLGATVVKDGGCYAIDIQRGVRGVTIRDNTITMFATDCIAMYGYTTATDPADGPYDVTIENNDLSFSRRNNISIVSGENVSVTNNVIRSSGVVVAGDQNGKDIIILGDGPWAAPGIDIEPEARSSCRTILIADNVIDGCRSGVFLYNGNQANNSIQNVTIARNEIKNLVDGATGVFMTFLNVSPAGKIFKDIKVVDLKLGGGGRVEFWGGDHVRVDGIRGYTGGVEDDVAFGPGTNRTLNIRSALRNALFSHITIGNSGLTTEQYGSVAQDLINIVFDETCQLNRSMGAMADKTVSSTRWFPEKPPAAQANLPLPIFENDHVYRSPLWFSGWRNGRPAGVKDGFMGWSPKSSTTRTVVASPVGTTLTVNATTAADKDGSIAFQYGPGSRWYHGTIVSVDSGTTYTVTPALASAAEAGQVAQLVRWVPIYGITKQPNIADTSGTTLADVTAKLNAALAALRAANILGDI